MSKKTENIVDAERMRYDVSKLLTKYINVKLPRNLDRQQLQGLKELKNDTNIKVVPFDKGTGFASMESQDMISKIREQIGDPVSFVVIQLAPLFVNSRRRYPVSKKKRRLM